MAPRVKKRKTPGNEESDAADAPLPAKRGARSARNPGLLDEYAVDEGRNSSRDFFSGAASSRKRRSHVNATKKELQKKKNELLAIINDQQKHSSAFDAIVALPPDLAAVLKDPHVSSNAISLQNSEANLLEPALQIIKGLQQVAQQYEQLAKHDTKIKRPDCMHWEQDTKDLVVLDNEARRITEHAVFCLITPRPGPPPGLVPPEADGPEMVAWEMLEDTRTNSTEETWGRMTQGVVKIFTELLGFLRSDV